MLEPEHPDVRGGAACCGYYRENVQFLGMIWAGEWGKGEEGGQREKGESSWWHSLAWLLPAIPYISSNEHPSQAALCECLWWENREGAELHFNIVQNRLDVRRWKCPFGCHPALERTCRRPQARLKVGGSNQVYPDLWEGKGPLLTSELYLWFLSLSFFTFPSPPNLPSTVLHT